MKKEKNLRYSVYPYNKLYNNSESFGEINHFRERLEQTTIDPVIEIRKNKNGQYLIYKPNTKGVLTQYEKLDIELKDILQEKYDFDFEEDLDLRQDFFFDILNPALKEQKKPYWQTCMDDFTIEDQNTLLQNLENHKAIEDHFQKISSCLQKNLVFFIVKKNSKIEFLYPGHETLQKYPPFLKSKSNFPEDYFTKMNLKIPEKYILDPKGIRLDDKDDKEYSICINLIPKTISSHERLHFKRLLKEKNIDISL